MKLKHLPVALIFLFCCPGLIYAQEYTFRQTRWGMTQAEVRNAGPDLGVKSRVD